MLLAMNVDPIFTQAMKKHPESEHYFIKGKDNLLYGTKYFYLVYHNCIDNLWLINTAANTGRGKGNEEALSWLRKHPRFGEAFFGSLGGEGAIDQSTILYLTPEGNMLAQAARKWFQLTYKQEIAAMSYFKEQVLKPSKARLEKIPHEKDSHQKKRMQLNMMARLSLAKIIMQHSSSSSQDSSSIPRADAEINEKNLQKMDQAMQKNIY